MAFSTKYFVTRSSTANFLDLELAYGTLSLQGQELVFSGSTGVDAVYVHPGVTVDLTNTKGGQDKIYLQGNWSDYTSNITLDSASGVMTLSRVVNGLAETVKFVKASTVAASDVLIFGNGIVNTKDIFDKLSTAQALSALTPNSAGETSVNPIKPSVQDTVVKAIALDPTGEVFTGFGRGPKLEISGSNGVDTIYIKDGSVVDASNLKGGQDIIYFRGHWADYTKSVDPLLGNLVFTRSVMVDGLAQEEKVIVSGGSTLSSRDCLTFADGSVLTHTAKAAVIANPLGSIDSVVGYNNSLVTPGLDTTLTLSTSLGLDNKALDVSSNIVLAVGESVTAVAGHNITLTDLGGGYRGENTNHTLTIDATDARVKILGTGAATKIVVDPDIGFDLDLSSNYRLSVDAGAFVGMTSNKPSAALQNINFSTVTPGTTVALAQQAYRMDESTGQMVLANKWVDIEGQGHGLPSDTGGDTVNVTDTTFVNLNASGGDYTFVFKDSQVAGVDTTNFISGIEATTDFAVILQNFGATDRVYIDDAFNDKNKRNDINYDAFVQGSGAVGSGLKLGLVGANGDPQLFIELENAQTVADATLTALNTKLGLSGQNNNSAIMGDGAGLSNPSTGGTGNAIDTTPPTVAITRDKTNLGTGQTATLTFTFSEVVTDFVLGDITVSGGTLSNFVGSGTVYTAVFTPTANSTATGLVSVASGKFSDVAGNQNVDGLDANNSVSFSINTVVSGDTTPPTIAISSDKTSLTSGQTATLTFTLSESVTDFVSADITVSGGALSNFSGSGTSYTATFTPTANSTVAGLLSVASGKFSDAAGNYNTDGVDANNAVGFSINTMPQTNISPFIAQATDSFGSITGTLSTNAVTDDAHPKLTINANPGLSVVVYTRDSVEYQATINGATTFPQITTPRMLGKAVEVSPGVYEFVPGFGLHIGPNTLTVVATQPTTNVAQTSPEFNLNIDGRLPVAGTLALINKTDEVDNNFDLTLTGNEVGSTVVYQVSTDSGVTWATTTPTQSALNPNGYSYRAMITDTAGNKSVTNTIQSVVMSPGAAPETQAPVAPTVSISGISSGSFSTNLRPTITVQAESGSTVLIYDHIGTYNGTTTVFSRGQLLGQASPIAAGSTTYSFTPSSDLSISNYGFYAVALDANGNASPLSNRYELSIGANLYSNVNFQLREKYGISDSNFYFSVTDTAATVTYVRPGSSLVRTPDGAGDALSMPYDGTAVVSIKSNGVTYTCNVKRDSTLTGDTTTPSVPLISAVTDDFGVSVGALVNGASTDDTTPTVSVTTEANATVRFFDGANLLGSAVANSSGIATFTPSSALGAGLHSLSIRATDAYGNSSGFSGAFAVNVTTGTVVDTTPPVAPSLLAVNDDVAPVLGNVVTGGTSNDAKPTLKIQAEAGSTVEVFDGSTSLGFALATPTAGYFSFTPATALSAGNHALTAKAKDSANNVSGASSVYNMVVDVLAPTVGVLSINNKANDADNTFDVVLSSAESGAAVMYQISANNFNTWTEQAATGIILTTNDTYQIRAVITDAAGNVSYSNVVNTLVNVPATGVDVTAPVFTSPLHVEIDNYHAVEQIVYVAASTDTQGSGNVHYSLEVIPQYDVFTINPDNGVVSMKAMPNFDRQAVYELTVVATDAAGNVSKRPITIGITGATLEGDATVGTMMRIWVTDPNGARHVGSPGSGTNWQIVNDYMAGNLPEENTQIRWFADGVEISGIVAQKFTVTSDLIGKRLSAQMTFSDGTGASKTLLTDLTTPVADFASIPENTSTTVYTPTNPFASGAVPVWTVSGADAMRFNINSSSGALTFKNAPDFEIPNDQDFNHRYQVTLTANSGGVDKSIPLTVKVTDALPVMGLTGLNNTSLTRSSYAQLIDTDVAFTASDNLSGGQLVVSGLLSTDQVSVNHQGTDHGQIGVTGNTVSYEGQTIGTLSGGLGTDLVIALTPAASPQAIDSLIQSLTFADKGTSTTTVSRTLSIKITDANGADLRSAGQFVEQTGVNNPFNGFDAGTQSSTAFGDLNADGRLDMVSGNTDGIFKVWLHNGSGFTEATGTNNPFNGFSTSGRSAVALYDLQGNGTVDLIATDYGGQFSLYRKINGVYQQQNKYVDPFDNENSCFYRTIGFSDIDGNGLKDILAIDDVGRQYVYLQNDGVYQYESKPSYNNPFSNLTTVLYGKPTFADIDNDGDDDLVMGQQDGTLRTWRNDGNWKSFTELTGTANPFNGVDVGNYSSPTFVDLYGNGDLWLVVGKEDGTFSAFKQTVGSTPALTLTVTPGTGTNTAPVIVSTTSATTVAENSTGVVYQVLANDAEGNVLTWSLGGSDASQFNISSTGAISFRVAPNYEAPTDTGSNNVYDIVVNVTDGALTASKNLSIAVTDVMEQTPQQLALDLINRFRADPQGELARVLGVAPSKLDAVDADGSGTADVAIVRSSGTDVGDGTDWSTGFWQNLLGSTNVAQTLDYFHVSPGDLMYQWDHLPAAGTLQALQSNTKLNDSATAYAQIVVNDAGATADPHHVAPYTANDLARFTDKGYTGIATAAENLAKNFNITDPAYLHAGYIIDWGPGAVVNGVDNGIQDATGHRANMLSAAFTEAGVGQVAGWTAGNITQVQHFGDQTATEMLWGYAWDENSATNQFSLAEALIGVSVRLKSGTTVLASTSTNNYGGYSMDVHAVTNGTYALEFVSSTGLVLGSVNSVTVNDNPLQNVNFVI